MRDKSLYGTKCNSCGQCCANALCPLASRLLGKPIGADGPCPMLKFDANGDSSCGVVADPALFAPVKCRIHGVEAMRSAALFLIGAGFGCDGQVEGEPDNPDFRRRIHGCSREQFEQRNRSILMWGLQHLVPPRS